MRERLQQGNSRDRKAFLHVLSSAHCAKSSRMSMAKARPRPNRLLRALAQAGVIVASREWKCRITLVVYPWPDNVATGDRNSIQVTYWRHWADSWGVRFVDGFAPFFREPAAATVGKYFIQGDAHFTPQGHRLLFEELRSVSGL